MREKQLNSIEIFIKQGHLKRANLLILKEIENTNLTPQERLLLANYSRRVGKSLLGLKLLKPSVIGKERQIANPTNEELYEYTLLCINLGLNHEARRYISKLDKLGDQKILLQKAFLAIIDWDYQSAGEILNEYIAYETDPYLIDIAYANLLASMVHLKNRESITLSKKLEEDWIKKEQTLLLSHLHSQMIEYHYFTKNIKQAKKHLSSFHLYSDNKQTYTKWDILLSNNAEIEIKNKLLALRSEQSPNINFKKDIDFHLAYLLKSEELANKLYYTTAQSSFRSYLKINFTWANFPKQYLYGDKDVILNQSSGIILKTTTQLQKKFMNISSLFSVLTSDIYIPKTLFQLFSEIFPDQNFIGEYSLNSMHQLIHRSRKFLIDENLPFEIICHKQKYKLGLKEGGGILYNERKNKENLELIISKFLSRYRDSQKSFTRTDLESITHRSPRKTQQILANLLEQSIIIKKEAGKSTSYFVLSNTQI